MLSAAYDAGVNFFDNAGVLVVNSLADTDSPGAHPVPYHSIGIVADDAHVVVLWQGRATARDVTFVIDGRQLYVFVITPTPITVNLPKPPKRTWLSRYSVAYEIYPNNEMK